MVASTSLPFLLFGGIGWTELLVILAIVMLLFGGTRLPQLARSLGQSVIEFKKGIKHDDDAETPAGDDKKFTDKSAR